MSKKAHNGMTPSVKQQDARKVPRALPIRFRDNDAGKPEIHPDPSISENPTNPFSKGVAAVSGIKTEELSMSVVAVAGEALLPLVKNDATDAMNLAAQAMHDYDPQDAIEARLAAQAQATWQHGMRALSLAGSAKTLEGASQYANVAIKLLRLHNETVDTAAKYRNKGEQRVIIQHVSADKAIVNNFGGGGGRTNSEGDNPCPNCAAPVPEPKTIDHAASPPWPTAAADFTVVSAPEQGQEQDA